MKSLLWIMALALGLVYSCTSRTPESGTTETTRSTPDSAGPKAAVEVLDVSETDMVDKAYKAFLTKNVDEMVSYFSDNAKVMFSNGDSLDGKEQIRAYYQGRSSLMDSLSHSDVVYLPVQVNTPQYPNVSPGKWILRWGLIHVTYKNGKKVHIGNHISSHLNEAGKIDFQLVYMDMHPAMEATKGLTVKK